MSYTDADLERATNWLEVDSDDDDIPLHNELAQLIADIRNETIERCAVFCDGYAQNMEQAADAREKQGKPNTVAMSKADSGKTIGEVIRALKDGGK